MTNRLTPVFSLSTLVASVIIYLLTFPNFHPDYASGLDSSYVWAFNYLFENDFASLKQLIYPLGPLAFLKDPLVIGLNFEIFLAFYTVLKLWFTYLFISVADRFGNKKTLSYLLVTLILLVANVDYILVGLTFLNAFLFLNHTKRRYLLVGVSFLLATVGLTIKSSLGIMSFSVIGMAILIEFLQARQIKGSLKFIGIGTAVSLAIGTLIFGGLGAFVSFAFNMLRLAFGYSSALSIFPQNNWLLLTGLLVTLALPLVLFNDKKLRFSWLILLPTLFATWKHAMSRQDASHANILFVFLILYWAIFIAVSQKNTGKIMLVSALSVMLYYSNLQNVEDFSPKSIQINGIVNFQDVVLNLDSLKVEMDSLSLKGVSNNQLNEGFVSSILKDKTIDSYPWELSYFAANPKLNWKPRRTLQSGSFAPWLDQYNAEDFNRENGPDHLLFHFVDDPHGGKFGSIDNRYLLNDNPRTIRNIFNFYTPKQKTGGFLLLGKNKQNNLTESSQTETRESSWNEWITVESPTQSVSRLHVSIDRNLTGKLKSFLFKSWLYEIDYLLESEEVLTYRFVPTNAVDGIWINPLILNPINAISNSVVKVRLRTTCPQFNREQFSYHFENFGYLEEGKQTDFSAYFEVKIPTENIVVNYFRDFETEDAGTTSLAAYAGKKSNLVEKLDKFSHTYSLLLDTLWDNLDPEINNLSVQSSLVYQNPNSKGLHVITVGGSEDDFYNSKDLLTTNSAWKNASQSIELNREKHRNGELKIYLWNNGNTDLYMDDFKVLITKLSTQ